MSAGTGKLREARHSDEEDIGGGAMVVKHSCLPIVPFHHHHRDQNAARNPNTGGKESSGKEPRGLCESHINSRSRRAGKWPSMRGRMREVQN